ncbi:unnamed protein product [Orchesella dallaii]|uniref:FAD-binding PCMH-type domain-containing protein n=1 Tax=Orchesella dallaii TaxID=48710 RepID=A0ABP1R0L9_9HEXA
MDNSNNRKLISFKLRSFMFCLLLMAQNIWMTISTDSRTEFSYQSYQHNILCTASQKPEEPTTIADIQAIIAKAISNQQTVKALGNLHSVTDCFCTTGIPITMKNVKNIFYDPLTELVTVGAGSTLHDLQEFLHNWGRALEDAPSYGDITVGGALGTGAHGTSLRFPSSLSDQLVSVTIVDGRGIVRNFTAVDNIEEFQAFRVHLGLLGIIFQVVFKTIPQYKLQVHNYPMSDDILWKEGEILKLAENNDRFQFWWFPSSKSVVLSVGNRVPANTTGSCKTNFISNMPKANSVALSMTLELMQKTRDRVGFHLIQEYAKLGLYKEVPGRDPMYTDENTGTICAPVAVGYSHRMVTNKCEECFWEQGPYSLLDDDANIALPLDQLQSALETIRRIVIDEYETYFPLNGIYFRFLTSSDAYVAINSGRKSVSIEWITVPRYDKSTIKLGLPAYQAMGQALINKHDGRPHWGKNGLFYSNPAILTSRHPHLQDFVKVMKTIDPNGIFLNDLGSRIRFGSQELTVNPTLKKQCALNDVCFCKSDRDCGGSQSLLFSLTNSITCESLIGYKVCKENSLLNVLPVSILQTRNAINTLKGEGNNSEERIYNALSKYKMLQPIFVNFVK